MSKKINNTDSKINIDSGYFTENKIKTPYIEKKDPPEIKKDPTYPETSRNMECMLSTVDNPYNPYIDWNNWLKWDMLAGYNCCGYLARMTMDYPYMSDNKKEEAIVDAIYSIIAQHPNGPYTVVYPM